MYRIEKQFDFCYGHRVWNQQLNAQFSLDSCHACRRLHGHQGTIHIALEANVLENGMVTDFKHLNVFKKWLDDTLDHKFIIDNNDPAKETLFPLLKSMQYVTDNFYNLHTIGNCEYATVNEKLFKNKEEYIKEIYEGLVIVNFVPTSENLSAWLFNIIQEQMQPLGVKVAELKFHETPKSHATYTP